MGRLWVYRREKSTGNDLTKILSSTIASIFQLQGMSNAWTRSVSLKKKTSVTCLDLYGWQQQTAVSVCATYGLHFPNERASMCMCSTEFRSKLKQGLHEIEYMFCQSDVSPPTLTNCQTPNQSQHKLLRPPQIKNAYNTFILGTNYIHPSI